MGVLVVMLISSIGFLASDTKAASREDNSGCEGYEQGDCIGVGIISFSDDEIIYSNPLGISAQSNSNASVTDNGVRLRKKPSTSSTILE